MANTDIPNKILDNIILDILSESVEKKLCHDFIISYWKETELNRNADMFTYDTCSIECKICNMKIILIDHHPMREVRIYNYLDKDKGYYYIKYNNKNKLFYYTIRIPSCNDYILSSILE